MKKIILSVILASVLMLVSCTENHLARTWGGTMTIELPAGQKLMMATWKDDNLFYLTEPMDENDKPKTKTFQEKSSFGALETTVIFIEKR